MELIKKVFLKTEKEPENYQVYEDLYFLCKNEIENGNLKAVEYLRKLSDKIEIELPKAEKEDEVKFLFDLHKRVLLAGARYNFHMYLLYIEWNREPDKKFYPPRRKVLGQVVEALQELADDKLDLLAVSLPPGSGKTTLAIFYLTWLAGRIPNEPMLTGSHSNSFVRGVYDECLKIGRAHV